MLIHTVTWKNGITSHDGEMTSMSTKRIGHPVFGMRCELKGFNSFVGAA